MCAESEVMCREIARLFTMKHSRRTREDKTDDVHALAGGAVGVIHGLIGNDRLPAQQQSALV